MSAPPKDHPVEVAKAQVKAIAAQLECNVDVLPHEFEHFMRWLEAWAKLEHIEASERSLR